MRQDLNVQRSGAHEVRESLCLRWPLARSAYDLVPHRAPAGVWGQGTPGRQDISGAGAPRSAVTAGSPHVARGPFNLSPTSDDWKVRELGSEVTHRTLGPHAPRPAPSCRLSAAVTAGTAALVPDLTPSVSPEVPVTGLCGVGICSFRSEDRRPRNFLREHSSSHFGKYSAIGGKGNCLRSNLANGHHGGPEARDSCPFSDSRAEISTRLCSWLRCVTTGQCRRGNQ